MRLLERTADRLVGLFVPKATAGACECRPEPFWVCCSHNTAKRCQYDCNCKIYCGPCQLNNSC